MRQVRWLAYYSLARALDVGGKKVRFLRRIPQDSMTGSTEWGLRSMQDDPTSDSWGGQNVFDVYTKTTEIDGDGDVVSRSETFAVLKPLTFELVVTPEKIVDYLDTPTSPELAVVNTASMVPLWVSAASLNLA